MNHKKEFLKEIVTIAESIDLIAIDNIKKILIKIKKTKGRIFFVGSGGGAGHASHAVNDFRKLCNIESYSPSDNVSELTARINDDGWSTSYSNWLKVSNLNKKDCLFIFSVGGGDLKKNISMNITESIKIAKKRKAKVIGVVSEIGGYTYKNADACLKINVSNKKLITPLVESYQAIIWHLLVSDRSIISNKPKW